MANIGTAASGKVLQGAGTGNGPTFSTATYPATATGTGKVLIADGTNWVASTPTYPNAAGTSGNLLQSDGTNWVSTTPVPKLISTSFTLSNAQIKSGTAFTLVAAQGAGTVILPVNMALKMNYGGTNAFTSAPTIYVQYGSAITSYIIYSFSSTMTNFWQATANAYAFGQNFQPETNPATQYENTLLTIGFSAPTGNAANNNTVTGNLVYYVISI